MKNFPLPRVILRDSQITTTLRDPGFGSGAHLLGAVAISVRLAEGSPESCFQLLGKTTPIGSTRPNREPHILWLFGFPHKPPIWFLKMVWCPLNKPKTSERPDFSAVLGLFRAGDGLLRRLGGQVRLRQTQQRRSRAALVLGLQQQCLALRGFAWAFTKEMDRNGGGGPPGSEGWPCFIKRCWAPTTATSKSNWEIERHMM